jgi:hypothetical protein
MSPHRAASSPLIHRLAAVLFSDLGRGSIAAGGG